MTEWGKIGAVIVGIMVLLAFAAFADDVTDRDHDDDDEG